ncbi:MAG: TRAP transporter substrate-binding protein [Rhizobiaceae bacterium]
MKLLKLLTAASVAIGAFSITQVSAKELSLAYFMGPKHPMNRGVFTPFAEKLKEVSGGALTVKQYAGGALNKVPPKQYSILLDNVADIVFTLPGYTADVFPKTNVVGLPGVCDSALECTEGMIRAKSVLEKEFNAKVLALWSNAPPVLITKDKPVTKLSDLQGMKVRVTSKSDVPFVEALGASAVAQPVTQINQNLTNGVIDAIMIDSSAVRSFKLHEPANYVTTWFPGSGSSFALLMNLDVYNGLTDQEKAWVDEASGPELALGGGRTYDKASAGGLKVAAENGNQMLEWEPGEREKIEAVIAKAMAEIVNQKVGDSSIGEVIKLMKGE